eukprot:723704-Hanusia_phi.AAC.4
MSKLETNNEIDFIQTGSDLQVVDQRHRTRRERERRGAREERASEEEGRARCGGRKETLRIGRRSQRSGRRKFSRLLPCARQCLTFTW